MKRLPIAAILFLMIKFSAAQSVGIGTTSPHASAQLDVSSTTKGVLMPRMNTAQRDAIATPARGLMIFNTDDNCTDIFDGAAWIKNCGAKQTGTATMSDNNWKQKANVPATSYGRAAAFSIGTKGYVVTDYGSLLEYDPAADTWTTKAPFPPGIRYRAVAFSIGTKGYFGTGSAGDPLKDDFWEYDPSTNTWAQKASFPGGVRKYAVGFSIGSKGYVGTGEDNSNYKNDFWEYDPVFNTWTQKANVPGDARSWAIGMSISSKGYVGGGNTIASNYGNGDFWEYNPATNAWTQRASLASRAMAVAFSIGSKGYAGTGTSYNYLNDFWEYDPAANAWQQKAVFPPGGRFRCIGFSIGTMGYIGGGDVLTSFYNDFWEYNTAPTSVPSYSSSSTPVAAVISDGAWTRSGSQIYNTLGGNVGIGTASPTAKLHIAGPFRLEDGSQGNGKVLVSDANGLASWQAGVPNVWSASGTNIYNSNTGNIGIGISNPGFPLNFSGASGDKISLWGNSGSHYGFGIQSGLLQIHSNTATDNIGFGYGSSNSFNERARIINSGELGMSLIGRMQLKTGSSSAGLWLTNTANTSNVSFIGMAADNLVGFYGAGGVGWGLTMNTTNGNVGIGMGTASSQTPLQFSNSLGLTKISLYKGTYGDVGIGVYGGELRLQNDIPNGKVSMGVIETTGAYTELAKAEHNGAYAFSIFGNLWANGTTYASDERFKQNVTAIQSPLQKLIQLNGVEYEMKTTAFAKNHFTPGRQMGLIAQNVEKIIPEAVSEMDGYKGVDYARLVPLLIESIKELQKEVEELKAKIK